MTLENDMAVLKADLAKLKTMATTKNGLSPDARAAVLAAVVNGEASLLAVRAATTYAQSVKRDVTGPLTKALNEFPRSVTKLVIALRRLPDR